MFHLGSPIGLSRIEELLSKAGAISGDRLVLSLGRFLRSDFTIGHIALRFLTLALPCL